MLTDEERKEHSRAASRRYRQANAAELNADRRTLRRANPEKEKLRRALYRKMNIEKEKLRDALYRKSHPRNLEEDARRSNLYRESHLDESKRRCSLYRKNHPEKCKLYKSKRRSLTYANTPLDELLTSMEWLAILALADGHCTYCGKKTERLTLDHIIPLSKGGKHSRDNVVPACKHCNDSKGTKTVEAWQLA